MLTRQISRFDEETHTYYDQFDKPFISTTQLLKIMGVTPDYSFVNQRVLEMAARRGQVIHKEIEEYIKYGKIGFTIELGSFIDYIKRYHLKPVASELMVNDDNIAGTIDIILQTEDGKLILADIKTTSSRYPESVSWQISIYKKLLGKWNGQEISALQELHFTKAGKIKPYDIPQKSLEEINNLIMKGINKYDQQCCSSW